jgi:hypothetical protein
MSRRLEDPKHPRPRRTFRERVTALAVTVLALNVAMVVFLLVGWLAGWLSLSIGRDQPQSQWRFLVRLNTGQVADDLQETVATLEAAVQMDTVVGEVVANNSERDRITVETEKGKRVTARINEATELKSQGDATSASAFQAGDRVELVFREQNGRNEAVRIAHLERN